MPAKMWRQQQPFSKRHILAAGAALGSGEIQPESNYEANQQPKLLSASNHVSLTLGAVYLVASLFMLYSGMELLSYISMTKKDLPHFRPYKLQLFAWILLVGWLAALGTITLASLYRRPGFPAAVIMLAPIIAHALLALVLFYFFARSDMQQIQREYATLMRRQIQEQNAAAERQQQENDRLFAQQQQQEQQL